MIHFLFQTDQASNCQDAKESTVNELEFEIWMASPIFFSYEACLKENKKSFGKYIVITIFFLAGMY
jgi:hypothetical protein